jgi:hypothetical protein
MSLEDDCRKLLQVAEGQQKSIAQMLQTVDKQADVILELVANMQAMSAINHGLMEVMQANPTFVAGVKYATEHRDALFNASTMADAQIAAFKTNLRNLLPKDLKHLAD